MSANLLIYILMFPVIGVLVLCFIPAYEKKLLKLVALNASFLAFIGSLLLWGAFNKSTGFFQFVTQSSWFPILNLNFSLGVDGISLFFLLLTTLLIPLCLLISWDSVGHNLKEFLISFLVLDFLLIGVFCVLDLLFFYIFFETVLIPMYLVVGVWGSRERKILAAYYFFLYTLLGSIVMLISIIYILEQVGTTDYETLLTFSFSEFLPVFEK